MRFPISNQYQPSLWLSPFPRYGQISVEKRTFSLPLPPFNSKFKNVPLALNPQILYAESFDTGLITRAKSFPL